MWSKYVYTRIETCSSSTLTDRYKITIIALNSYPIIFLRPIFPFLFSTKVVHCKPALKIESRVSQFSSQVDREGLLRISSSIVLSSFEKEIQGCLAATIFSFYKLYGVFLILKKKIFTQFDISIEQREGACLIYTWQLSWQEKKSISDTCQT